MGRFRYSGVNWEGRPWAASQAIKQLGQQVEEAYPTRSGYDGTVASKTHDQRSPRSDHRPRPFSGFGRVRAIDIGAATDELIEAIRASRDPRIKYVIHKRRLFSSYNHANGPAWSWRPYSGSNSHTRHAHISVLANADANAAPWDIGEGGEIDVKEVYARLQASLVRAGYDLGTYTPYLSPDDPDSLPGCDGDWGTKSRAAQDKANAGSEGAVDAVARKNANQAHARLDQLHNI